MGEDEAQSEAVDGGGALRNSIDLAREADALELREKLQSHAFERDFQIDALKRKFPNIAGPHAQDICYATENRQVAVKNVAHGADLVLVVGSRNSSNSNRLVEVSKNLDTNSFLIDTADAIQPEWLEGVNTVAVTAGASAPEVLVKDVVEYLQSMGYGDVDEVEVMPENVRFALPPEIVQAIAAAPAR